MKSLRDFYFMCAAARRLLWRRISFYQQAEKTFPNIEKVFRLFITA